MKSKTRLLEDSFDIAPLGLEYCFERECFLDDGFQSNEFIFEQQRRGNTLEVLRDSLLQYSNILKSSLVELINEDYADFVNLSTNLVGLDKAIDQITTPLNDVNRCIQDLIQELDSVQTDLSTGIQERQQLREKKDLLNGLHIMYACVNRLERWLAPVAVESTAGDPVGIRKKSVHDSAAATAAVEASGVASLSNEWQDLDELDDFASDDDISQWPAEFFADSSLHEDPGQRIDRVANEYIKLQFFFKKCPDHPLALDLKPRIQWITNTLQEQLAVRLKVCLDAALLTADGGANRSITSKQAGEQLRQILSTYLAIDKLPLMIELYRQHVIRPKISKLFPPRSELLFGGSEPKAAAATLEELFSAATSILDHQLDMLHRLSLQRTSDSYDPLTEFDCITNAFWPELVDLLCENLPSLFAPGNPDRFHALYSTSMHFLRKLEAKMSSSERLHNFRHHPSYIRFNDKWSLPVYYQIRFQDIAGCVENAMHDGLKCTDAKCELECILHPTAISIAQIQRCWQDEIYLESLRHRFWKLTLQILSRYAKFIKDQVSKTFEIEHAATKDDDHSQIDITTSLLIHLLFDSHKLVVYIQTDLQQLIARYLEEEENTERLPNWIKQCLDESCQAITTHITSLEDCIAGRIERPFIAICRQVLDVPRQYRRTNRNLPNAPSNYVLSMIKIFRAYSTEFENNAKQMAPGYRISLERIYKCFLNSVVESYGKQLTELLISVKKTEDSLRKLRETRRVTGSSNLTTAGGGVYSDDDKIRHQLHLDACALLDALNNLWMTQPCLIDRAQELVQLTEASKSDVINQ